YQRIFSQSKHPRLSEALANTYLDIIELCIQFRTLIKAQEKSTLRRVIQPLSSDVEKQSKDAEAKFRAHRKTVEREAETCHMIEAAEVRAIVLRDRQLQEMNDRAANKKRLLLVLSTTNSKEKHEKLKSIRHQRTGDWIFSSSEYKRWRHLSSTSVLCCFGIRRSSVLGVIDSILKVSLSSPKSKTLAFHYCDHADKRTLEPVQIFGSRIRSIFEDREIPSAIREMIVKTYKEGERSPEILEVLDILFQSTDVFDEVTIAIDGIDEAREEDRQIIYEALNTLTKRNLSLKLFVSCREDVALSICSVASACFRLEVCEAVISTDIEGYTRDSIKTLLAREKIVLRNLDLKEDIVTALINGAKGMFLWVKFHFDDLCNAESDAEIKSLLQNLPKDLAETYDRLFSRIIGKDRQHLVKQIFQWIICARRPLKVDEICEGIGFSIHDKYWDEAKIPTDIFRLVRASGNLVVIDKATRTIQLAHYTVQQYILNDTESAGKFFQFSLKEANELLGEVCVAYLNLSDFGSQLTTFVDNKVTTNMAFIERAVPDFGKVQVSGSPINLTRLSRTLQSKGSRTNIDYGRHIPKKNKPVEHLLTDYRLLKYVRENWLWHTANFAPNGGQKSMRDILFHNLVLQKQLPFSFRPWQSNKDLTLKYCYLEPVGWALVTNHCPLLYILLKTDPKFKPWEYLENAAEWFFLDRTNTHISADMMRRLECCSEERWDAKSIPRQGWLYCKIIDASRRGNRDILELCLRHSSHLSSLKPYRWEQLKSHIAIEAAANNRLDLVKLIVDYTVTIHFTMVWNGEVLNALELAALSGHTLTTSYLFQNGWHASNLLSLNAGSGLKHLRHAADGRNAEVYEALLNILILPITALGYSDLREGILGIFIFTAMAGYLSLVKIGCHHGLDPLEADGGRYCAYMRAIRNGRLDMVVYLLSRGCGVNNNAEGLPLTMAASMGHLEIAQILIAHGADPFSNSSDAENLTYVADDSHNRFSIEISPTPLYAAAVNGHLEMVKYLLACGAGSDILSPTGLLVQDTPRLGSRQGKTTQKRRRLLYSDMRAYEIQRIQSIIDVAHWQRPLAGAALNGRKEIVELLLRTQLEIDAKDSNKDTTLFLAAIMGHAEIVKLLHGAGAIAGFGSSALDQLMACVVDPARIEALRLLLDLGVSPSIISESKETAFSLATTKGSVQALEMLLSNQIRIGSMLEFRNTHGRTPLLAACNQGGVRAVSVLLDAGANINVEDSSQNSPLLLATRARSIELAEFLLSKRVMVDAKKPENPAPVATACAKGLTEIVIKLLAHKADANCWLPGSHFLELGILAPKYGLKMINVTALMAAVINGLMEIVDSLINADANVNVKEVMGRTVMMYSIIAGSVEIASRLV
ncbi:hypothetical protein PVAG01_02040, partial [Phlyctema vagabunda]